jgi:hypothetical protein
LLRAAHDPGRLGLERRQDCRDGVSRHGTRDIGNHDAIGWLKTAEIPGEGGSVAGVAPCLPNPAVLVRPAPLDAGVAGINR